MVVSLQCGAADDGRSCGPVLKATSSSLPAVFVGEPGGQKNTEAARTDLEVAPNFSVPFITFTSSQRLCHWNHAEGHAQRAASSSKAQEGSQRWLFGSYKYEDFLGAFYIKEHNFTGSTPKY